MTIKLAQALMLMKKFEEAKEAFVKSASVGPNAGKENKNVARMLRECDIQVSTNLCFGRKNIPTNF
jgi:hypothetical protein